MWKHSVGIATENGYQLFVPIYNENSKDEINFIWNFKIYNDRLYHFTTKRPLSSDIVAEFWKFDYFTIYALGKKPKSGLSFERVESRTTYECVHASITVGEGEYEHTENKGWHCWQTDDKAPDDGDMGSGSGGGFPSDIPVEDGEGSGGGGNSGSSNPGGDSNDNASGSGVAPKAQAIFRNSNMTEQNWNVIENMLEKIVESCMGQNLYNGLLEKMNGGTFIIQFKENANGAFGPIGEGVGITLGMQMESNQLFHEMMHAYRSYQETTNGYNSSTLNGEFEAWYAQYLYTSSLPEYKNSKWERRDNSDERRKVIKKLNSFIDKKGNLQPKKSSMDLEVEILEKVIPAFRETYTEDKYPYDYTREAIDNFKNIKKLTEGC